MSSKQEDTSSEIPPILIDEKNNTKYQRCRFFGKVNLYKFFFSLSFHCSLSVGSLNVAVLLVFIIFLFFFFLLLLICCTFDLTEFLQWCALLKQQVISFLSLIQFPNAWPQLMFISNSNNASKTWSQCEQKISWLNSKSQIVKQHNDVAVRTKETKRCVHARIVGSFILNRSRIQTIIHRHTQSHTKSERKIDVKSALHCITSLYLKKNSFITTDKFVEMLQPNGF